MCSFVLHLCKFPFSAFYSFIDKASLGLNIPYESFCYMGIYYTTVLWIEKKKTWVNNSKYWCQSSSQMWYEYVISDLYFSMCELRPINVCSILSMLSISSICLTSSICSLCSICWMTLTPSRKKQNSSKVQVTVYKENNSDDDNFTQVKEWQSQIQWERCHAWQWQLQCILGPL